MIWKLKIYVNIKNDMKILKLQVFDSLTQRKTKFN